MYLHNHRRDWYFFSDTRIMSLWERMLIFIVDLKRNAGQNILKFRNVSMKKNAQSVKLIENLQ